MIRGSSALAAFALEAGMCKGAIGGGGVEIESRCKTSGMLGRLLGEVLLNECPDEGVDGSSKRSSTTRFGSVSVDVRLSEAPGLTGPP